MSSWAEDIVGGYAHGGRQAYRAHEVAKGGGAISGRCRVESGRGARFDQDVPWRREPVTASAVMELA